MGRVERGRLESEALRGNPLGDPHVRDVIAYLPPSYDLQPDRRFPVVLVLAGFTGRGASFLNDSPWVEPLDARMDRLIAEGCPEAILVMPDCFTKWGGSQYVDSSATGRYETHVLDEILPFADRQWRTMPDARGVVGKSSGGFGAAWLALQRPGAFRAVVSHSGDCAFEYCYLRDFPSACDSLARRGGLTRFLADFPSLPNKGGKELAQLINIVAMSSCYSPDASAPDGFVLPFDPETGAVREDVWRRWLAFDPVRAPPARLSTLGRLALLMLDCGVRDEFALHLGARMLSRRLRDAGVKHEHLEYDDGHFGVTYRYDVSLPRVVRALLDEPR